MDIAAAIEAREVTKKLSAFQLARCRRGKKIYLGHEQHEGWTGKLPFYLSWCDSGKHFVKDYPHGHIERQYLFCPHCKRTHSFVPWWVGWMILFQAVKFLIRFKLTRS